MSKFIKLTNALPNIEKYDTVYVKDTSVTMIKVPSDNSTVGCIVCVMGGQIPAKETADEVKQMLN